MNASRMQQYMTWRGYLSNPENVRDILSKAAEHSVFVYNIPNITSSVFVKRIRIPRREKEAEYDTSNLYEFPAGFHYARGVRSLNVWRELAAHKIVSDCVLSGKCAAFPLLYGHSIEPIPHQKDDEWPLDTDNPRSLRHSDAYEATHELVLFLECIPQTLGEWMQTSTWDQRVQRLPSILSQLMEICRVLRTLKLYHFDMHSFNLLLDDHGSLYLTDFGLASSPSFDLSFSERLYLESHRWYDAASAITYIFDDLLTFWNGHPMVLAEAQRMFQEGLPEAMPQPIRDIFKPYKQICVLYLDYMIRKFRFISYDEERMAGRKPETSVADVLFPDNEMYFALEPVLFSGI